MLSYLDTDILKRKREMGNGKWEMGNGKWEMENGNEIEASSESRLFWAIASWGRGLA